MLLAIAVITSLMAAALNAGSSVLERLASSPADSHKLLGGEQVLANIINKLFLSGMSLQVLAFIMQAIALSDAPLVVVEPLLITDLLFLLLIIHFKLHVITTARDWVGALAMIFGMSGFFLAAQPRGGQVKYTLTPWIIVLVSSLILILILLYVVRSVSSPKLRAGFGAGAASITFAINAALTKLSLNLWHSHGLWYLFMNWPLYVLAISGFGSIYLMQLAFSSGPLVIAQPVMEVTEPTLSVIIGIVIFGDSIRHGRSALIAESLAIILIGYGIVILSTSSRMHDAGKRRAAT